MSLGSALQPGLAIVEMVDFGAKVHQVLDLNIKNVPTIRYVQTIHPL